MSEISVPMMVDIPRHMTLTNLMLVYFDVEGSPDAEEIILRAISAIVRKRCKLGVPHAGCTCFHDTL
jgi:hypothetical protein